MSDLLKTAGGDTTGPVLELLGCDTVTAAETKKTLKLRRKAYQ